MDKIGLRNMVQETLEKVNLVIIHVPVVASNLRGELTKLLELLIKIRALLAVFISLNWLNKLKQVAFQAEDLIDELAYYILPPKVLITEFTIHKMRTFDLKFSHEIQTLNQSLNIIIHGIRDRLSDRIPSFSFLDLLTDHPIIGREADASKIVNLVTSSCSDDQQQLLTVVPIVGMAGLGKTALAKLVCRQLMVLDLFDVKMWVCVSDRFDELTVLRQMLRFLNASIYTKDEILEQLETELRGKRFLLVLDDVWEDVSRWWDGFRTRLLKICTNNGNVVLVTTRSVKVASIVQTSSQHRYMLGFLSDDECWFILKESAFRELPPYKPLQSDLEVIGMQVAKKCEGVPLVANILGGIMTFNRWGERQLLELRDSRSLKAWNKEKNVESMLRLSFDSLPSFLKPCFAICSVFPKGFLIIKEDLIRLWMVERFVDSCDMGNQFFYALVAYSFFHDVESDDNGNLIKCKMHNLVHDFALSLEKSSLGIHYLYADCQSIRPSKALTKNKAMYLRTIILNGAPFKSSWNSKHLRTLYLNDVDMESFPPSISKLKHLRYLHVSNAKIPLLPKSISEIYTLQILTLSNCSCERLPHLGDLPFLKFLKISHMKKLKYIGTESYAVKSSQQHELRLFPALKSLSLSWMDDLTEWSPPSHGNNVVAFPCLENLSIQSCPKLTGFPMRDVSTLVKVEINDCEELRFIFDKLKFFSSITTLSIAGCPKLTYLQNRLLSNDSCKEFRLRRCVWLKFIPEALGMQIYLVSLQIYCCKRLVSFSEEILCKLTQLRKLSIGAFSEKLDDFSYLNRIKDLIFLEELEIWGSDVFSRKMSVLPNQLQHLGRLQSLKIKGFTAMEVLPEWLSNLRSLKTISLNYCWHLGYQSSAAIIQRLNNLSHVYISGCHDLDEHKSQWMEFSSKTNIEVLFQ